MNLLEWLQNLKQHSTPIGAFCGKKFDHESQPFYRYGFPPVTQFFDSRTVQIRIKESCCSSSRKICLLCCRSVDPSVGNAFTSRSIRCSRRVRCCRPIKCCKFVEKCIRPFNLMKKATNGFSNSHAYFMCLSYIGKRFSSRHNKISKLSTSKIGHRISHSSHPHHHVLVECTQRPVETVEQ